MGYSKENFQKIEFKIKEASASFLLVAQLSKGFKSLGEFSF